MRARQSSPIMVIKDAAFDARTRLPAGASHDQIYHFPKSGWKQRTAPRRPPAAADGAARASARLAARASHSACQRHRLARGAQQLAGETALAAAGGAQQGLRSAIEKARRRRIDGAVVSLIAARVSVIEVRGHRQESSDRRADRSWRPSGVETGPVLGWASAAVPIRMKRRSDARTQRRHARSLGQMLQHEGDLAVIAQQSVPTSGSAAPRPKDLAELFKCAATTPLGSSSRSKRRTAST